MATEFHGIAGPGQGKQEDEVHPSVSIVFPRREAPDVNTAMDVLFDAFPDHEPRLSSASADSWTFRLHWTSDPRAFVDPGVVDAANNLYGLDPTEIGGFRKIYQWGKCNVVISMVHSWALLAPAKATARRGNRPPVWIVHVDDHTDLMALPLEPLSQPGSLRDNVFGEDISLGDAKSVVAAVRRGAVNKGNFLTAYMLAYPLSQVVHIGRNLPEHDCWLHPQREMVRLGGRQFTKNGLVPNRVPRGERWNFRQKHSLPANLQATAEEGIWLDIDLDYFLNRYNGDSDRCSESASPSERDEVMRRVNQFLCNLCASTWLTNVEAVSIAVSPGFFPAEYWREVISTLSEGIRSELELRQ